MTDPIKQRYDERLRMIGSMQRCKTESLWRPHLTFSTHFAFNTLNATRVEEGKLCLRTTRSAASSHAKTSPSTVCRNFSG